MKKVYQAISIILHPVFLPMVAAWVYLNVLPLPISRLQIYLIFFIVFGATFLVPILTLFLLRFMGYVKTNQVVTIKERKFPIAIMVVNYLFLGQMLGRIWQLRELTILAYAIALGLVITGALFYKNLKVSLHMLGISALLGFTLVFGANYNYPVFVIALLVALVGVLATARLKLKAHNNKEIIIGTCLGLFLPLILSFIL